MSARIDEQAPLIWRCGRHIRPGVTQVNHVARRVIELRIPWARPPENHIDAPDIASIA
jgi:hypothetical protein